MKIRKHQGINQKTGRLKKGYRYSGKKLKSGLPQIIKIKKQKGGNDKSESRLSRQKLLSDMTISCDELIEDDNQEYLTAKDQYNHSYIAFANRKQMLNRLSNIDDIVLVLTNKNGNQVSSQKVKVLNTSKIFGKIKLEMGDKVEGKKSPRGFKNKVPLPFSKGEKVNFNMVKVKKPLPNNKFLKYVVLTKGDDKFLLYLSCTQMGMELHKDEIKN